MNFRNALLGTALVAALAMPLLSCAADTMFLKAKGQKQGDIKGGVIQKGREGMIKVLDYSYSVISPRDPQSGLPTGKRMHKPFVVTAELDKSSPLLFNSIVTNENLPDVELHIWRPTTGAAGGAAMEKEYMTIKLTNANVASFVHKTMDKAGVPTVVQEISFTFQKIEITFVDGGVTASDDWEARV